MSAAWLHMCSKISVMLSAGSIVPRPRQRGEISRDRCSQAVADIAHAMHFASERVTMATQADICSLLAQMCHPDMTQRISASAVADIPWLRDAAAKPLASCPMHHVT